MFRMFKPKPVEPFEMEPIFMTELEIIEPITHTTELSTWEDQHEVCGSYSVGKCSRCGEYAQHRDYKGVGQHYRFCPFCGISMRRNYE